MNGPPPIIRALSQRFPVLDPASGVTTWWEAWRECKGGVCCLHVVDGAGRRVPSVREVRITDNGEILLVLRGNL